MKVYLASPLGFSPETRSYLEKIKAVLRAQGHEVFDPWEQSAFAHRIEAASSLEGYQRRIAEYKEVAAGIGQLNEDGIRRSDGLLAVLDGAEVDSGTAAELGFASALGKVCYGLRTDLRDSGDFPGVPINLQVLHFIERSGGVLFRRLDDLDIKS